MTYDVVTRLATWHDDIVVHDDVESCKKSNASQIMIPSWVEFSLKQVPNPI